MNRARITLTALLVLSLNAALMAQGSRDPNNARGFEPGKMYSFSEIDAVNNFNGNLMIRLPIGQSYPVSSALSYQLQLSYNSKIWDYVFDEYVPAGGGTANKRRAIPERDSNAGLGWSLSLGRILLPIGSTSTTQGRKWTYMTPDGAHHVIGGFTYYGSAPTTVYTDDGSYIRATHTSSSHVLEFPDGQTHTFDTYGRLTEIVDRFHNWIRITIGTTAEGAQSWTITDGHGTTVTRTHTVDFEIPPVAASFYDNYFDNPNFGQRVKRISLAAFPQPGQAAESARAVYTLHYVDTAIPRGACGEWVDGELATTNVPLLTGVDLPDGTRFTPDYQVSDIQPCQSGTIRELTLPTGGIIAWQHGRYELSATACSLGPETVEGDRGMWSYNHIGVTERKFTAPGAPPVKWTYEPVLVPGAVRSQISCHGQWAYNQPGPPEIFTNTITTPSGQKIKHYFSAFNAGYPSNLYDGPNLKDEYGLPLTRTEASGEFFLSTQISDAAGAVLRKTYVRYDHEEPVAGAPTWEHRPAAQRARFIGDSGCGPKRDEVCHVDSVSSDFDGYGHYRSTVESSNFGEPRSTYVDYNQTAGGTRVVGVADPWVLNLYSTRTVNEMGADFSTPSILVTKVCIDPLTGALKGQRWLKESTPGHTDVVARYTRDSAGNVITEDWYGGDHLPLQSTDLCTTSGAGTSEYQVNRTYQTGVLKTAQYRGMTHLDVDNTIEPNTGRVKASRDSSGLETTYTYDTPGRLTLVSPPAGMDMTYAYTNASSSAPASVKTIHGPVTLGTGRQTIVEFDGLGRVRREGELMPSGTWSYRYKTYDAAGRVAAETELGSTSESSLPTTFYGYDTFDRPVDVMRPDQSRTFFSYTGGGVRQKITSRAVRLPSGPQFVHTTENFDASGRLVEVGEKSGPTTAAGAVGADVATRYSYDAAGRLRLVKMNGTETVQTRVFDHDGRGFLRWEMHPESGMATYSYDSRGKARSKRVSEAASPYDLEFQYDGAERLLQVAGRNPVYDPNSPIELNRLPFRPIKTFEYASTSATGLEANPDDDGKGKLRSATRYNYPPLSNAGAEIIKVVEKYYYFDPEGRASDRTTEIWSNELTPFSFMKHATVQFTQAYDMYGQVSHVSYPLCVGCGVPGSRTVLPQYARGRLTGVEAVNAPAYAPSITYHSNGMRNAITHSNGMLDTQEIDVSGVPRPKRLVSSPSTILCTVPQITVQPVGKKIVSGESVVMSVAATGTGPLSYQWFDATPALAVPISGATGSSYTASPTATTKYYVEIAGACRKVASFTVVVAINTCPAPAVSATRTINKDGTVTLTATPTGVGVITCTWHRASDGFQIASGATVTVSAPEGLQELNVRATSDCDGAVGTRLLDAIAEMRYVTALQANVSLDRQSVVVQWPAVTGVSTYTLTRKHHSGAVTTFTVNGTQYTDSTVAPASMYAYSVTAESSATNQKVASNVDVASTIVFSPITAGVTAIERKYFDEVLAALNMLRALQGWPPLTWQSIMPPSVPVPQTGGLVYGFYITALRLRTDEVLHALGASIAGYTDPDPRLVSIRAYHVVELQRRAQ